MQWQLFSQLKRINTSKFSQKKTEFSHRKMHVNAGCGGGS